MLFFCCEIEIVVFVISHLIIIIITIIFIIFYFILSEQFPHTSSITQNLVPYEHYLNGVLSITHKNGIFQ
ncbi:hypothetical protein B6U98_02330 [Thermoplasmatales archaeon ex4572_165]|nr:MAG: hypothetical protein B6U98_02330 [Thermoplasmatales archaeon ex4572_165]RLF60032.1 MAG: hypothetical protein DRN27_00790 [Thermoplasmata archaeon]